MTLACQCEHRHHPEGCPEPATAEARTTYGRLLLCRPCLRTLDNLGYVRSWRAA